MTATDAGVVYTDATTTIAWFCVALLVVTLLGLLLLAASRHIEAAYLATLMSIKERRRK